MQLLRLSQLLLTLVILLKTPSTNHYTLYKYNTAVAAAATTTTTMNTTTTDDNYYNYHNYNTLLKVSSLWNCSSFLLLEGARESAYLSAK